MKEARNTEELYWRIPHNSCGQMIPATLNMAKPLEVEYRQPVLQSSDQSNSGRKEIEKPPCSEEIEGQGGITNPADSL